MRPEPELSVVVCSYNGADGLGLTLDSLNAQTIRHRLEVIVVDDGSSPAIEEIEVTSKRAILIRHERNLGLGAARNTGINVAKAPIVAFTDDDCRPTADWAENLLPSFDDPSVAGVGGPVVGSSRATFLARYYFYNEPVRPLEIELADSTALSHRFWLYVRRNFRQMNYAGIRDAYSLAGANCAFRRSILNDLGGFDTGIRFGGDDEDLCNRIRKTFPSKVLRIVPLAIVEHDYELSVHDMLRRAKSYGIGGARNYLKHPELSPTFYPAPALWTLSLIATKSFRRYVLLAILLPVLMTPRWVISAIRNKSLEHLAYGYLQVTQEAAHNVGFTKGLIRFRSTSFGNTVEEQPS